MIKMWGVLEGSGASGVVSSPTRDGTSVVRDRTVRSVPVRSRVWCFYDGRGSVLRVGDWPPMESQLCLWS